MTGGNLTGRIRELLNEGNGRRLACVLYEQLTREGWRREQIVAACRNVATRRYQDGAWWWLLRGVAKLGRPVAHPDIAVDENTRTPGLWCACGRYKGPKWPVCEDCAAKGRAA